MRFCRCTGRPAQIFYSYLQLAGPFQVLHTGNTSNAGHAYYRSGTNNFFRGSFCRRLNCPCMHMPHFRGSFCRRLNCPCLCMPACMHMPHFWGELLPPVKLPMHAHAPFRGELLPPVKLPMLVHACIRAHAFANAVCKHLYKFSGELLPPVKLPMHAHVPFWGELLPLVKLPMLVHARMRMPCACTCPISGELLPPVKLPMHSKRMRANAVCKHSYKFSGELLPPVKLPVCPCSCLLLATACARLCARILANAV
jgi:hypothetical protein